MTSRTRSRMTQVAVVVLFTGVVGTHALTEPKNDFHFSIIGDRTGGATPQIFGRVWREVDLLHPDFIVNVGDTIEGGNDATAQAQWNELRPVWEQYKHYPLYFTPGNHDIWSDVSQQIYEKETRQRTHYQFNYQDAHFTVLDNSRTNDLTQEQMRFLEEDLKANQDRRPKFVFFHRPFWIITLKLGSDFPLHQLAKKYGVDYIVSGHGHQFVRMKRDGIVYMEVGSSGGTVATPMARGEGFAQGRFYHHVWGRVKGSKVEFTVKEIDGPPGKGRMFKAEDWDDNGPHFDTGDPALTEKPRT